MGHHPWMAELWSMPAFLLVGVLLWATAWGCHGHELADDNPWYLSTDYPSNVSVKKSGIFYTFHIASTAVSWGAGRALCAEMYGDSATLYEPHDPDEMDYIRGQWLRQHISDKALGFLSVWTGLSKHDGRWRWYFGDQGDSVPVEDSGIEECATWEVVTNSWREASCDSPHPVLCKTVNHYREVYTIPEMDAMAALVVDHKNHTEAVSDCGNHGYQMYSVTTPEANQFLRGLFQRMRRATSFPFPALYWIDSGNMGLCHAWDALAGEARIVDCDRQMSYTCSYRRMLTPFPGESQLVSDSDTSRHPRVRRATDQEKAAVEEEAVAEDDGSPTEAPGSRTIGLITVAVLSVVCFLVMVSDLPTIYTTFKTAIGNVLVYCGCIKDYEPANTSSNTTTSQGDASAPRSRGDKKPPQRAQASLATHGHDNKAFRCDGGNGQQGQGYANVGTKQGQGQGQGQQQQQ